MRDSVSVNQAKLNDDNNNNIVRAQNEWDECVLFVKKNGCKTYFCLIWMNCGFELWYKFRAKMGKQNDKWTNKHIGVKLNRNMFK